MSKVRIMKSLYKTPALCGSFWMQHRSHFNPMPHKVEKMPWWMQSFEATTSPNGAQSPEATKLPSWPVDEVEFNTLLPHGGQDDRLAYEQAQRQRLPHPSGYPSGGSRGQEEAAEATETNYASFPEGSLERRAAVRAAEGTAAGQHALALGGWVCDKCLQAMPQRSRTVCDRCHTLRHDAATTGKGWRTDTSNWICGRCFEVNFDRDRVCRCCATAREDSAEVRAVYHERVADQVQRAAVGSVINTRNRVSRWLCAGCEEVNSLQASTCRHCNRERFSVVVGCPHCRAQRQLSNAQVYGSTPQDRKHAAGTFGTHNCFARLSPEQRCEVCRGSLHGGPVLSYTRASWWCACGVFNLGTAHSCQRCRLPRSTVSGGVLDRLLVGAEWDFQGCTSWFCEGCDWINLASRSVVHLKRDYAMDNSAKKYIRLLHGDVNCTHCGTPWHHHVLHDRACWRCACHLINSSEDDVCKSCGLPARDDIHVDVLSSWTKGDWVCGKCQAHCYRDRARCMCGNPRIKQGGKEEG